MSHLDIDNIIDNENPDWENALNHYQSVIASGSEDVQVKATIKLAQLSKRVPADILARVVSILARLLVLVDDGSNNSVRSIQVAAAYCLKRIACQADGALAREVGHSGAVQAILRLLPYSSNNSRRILLKCLCCLVNFHNVNRMIVARNGGLEIIIDMLNSCSREDRLYLLLLEILSALALLREARRVIVGVGGLRFLVEAARSGSMISRERACQAIGLLGLAGRVRRMLVELGVIQVLVELFRDGDGATKLVAGNSLGLISAHVDSVRPAAAAGAITVYAELLQGPEPVGKEIAEDVFCVLAVNEPNAVAIADHLVRILREGDDEAKIAASDVLWDLSGYKHSVSVVRNSGAIPILVELLRNGTCEVRERVSGAIAQLSYNKADRDALAEAGAVPILMELLHDESEELRDNALEAIVKFSEDPSQHDRVAAILDDPSFQSMQDRLALIRASDEHMVRSMRRMSIGQLAWDPDLV